MLLSCALSASVLPAIAQGQTPEQAPALQPAVPSLAASASAQKSSLAVEPNPRKNQVSPAATGQGSITEDELKQLLVGKPFYLRGGYLDNTLEFDEHGKLSGHSPAGSYTLNEIQINKVRLTKHKVELYGARFGLHFVGQLAYEDPATAADRVRITPKKKIVKITIDREMVVKPKREKVPKRAKEKFSKDRDKETDLKREPELQAALKPATDTSTAPQPPPATDETELSEADQLQASIAATSIAERPTDAKSVTTTTSPAHAAKTLKEALAKIFASGLDAQMVTTLPEYWQLYWKAVEAKTDYRPTMQGIYRQSAVDKKAHLLTQFEPDSNEFAQAAGVAGMALYHTIVQADGKAGQIVIGRPIGFGLDENAIAAIRKAQFEPAIKDGKPVPVLLDLVVQFRIFSKRTMVHDTKTEAVKPEKKPLPGPYTLQQMSTTSTSANPPQQQ
jgi:TonB family protein